MSNPNAQQPADSRAVFWVQQQVDDWIHAQIRGEDWQPVEPAQPVLIRKREVLRRVGLSYFSVWKMETAGRFPARVRIGHVASEQKAVANA